MITRIFVYIGFIINREIFATMNVAVGKQVSIEDDWTVLTGVLNRMVDGSNKRCVELEPVQGSTNSDLVIVSIDLQNFTRIVGIDIYSDPTNKLGVVFNDTDQATTNENECEVDRKCDATGRRMAFPFEGQQQQPTPVVRICEIKIFGCPVGYYGNECLQICRCLSGECDPDSGQCTDGQCIDGWTGSSCNTACPGGTYGSNCSNTCKGNCFGAMPCNPVTGDCQSGCTEGWTGQKCDTRIGPSAAELLNMHTTIGLVVMASMILILLALIIYCLFQRSPKPDENDTGRRSVVGRIFQSINAAKSLRRKNTTDKDEEDQQRISSTDILEAEYIDLNQDSNKNEQIQLPTTKKAAKAAKKLKVNDHYDSLAEKDDPSDVHFYDKKGQQLSNKTLHNTNKQHGISVRKPHFSASNNEYVDSLKTSVSNCSNETPRSKFTANNDSAKHPLSLRPSVGEFSSSLHTGNANIYLEPMEYLQTTTTNDRGSVDSNTEDIYDQPEVQAPKPSVKAVVQRLNSNQQTNNNGPISPKPLKQDSIKNTGHVFGGADGGFDSKEKHHVLNKTHSAKFYKRNHMTNGIVPYPHENGTTGEHIYEQPDNQYDYIEPPQKSRNLYPSLVRNGVKLPMMNFK